MAPLQCVNCPMAVFDGAANAGIRPQFEPPKELLEPHFFDFAEMIYDQMIECEFTPFCGLKANMTASTPDRPDRQGLRGCGGLAG
jgi:riboflavin kinase/FMN adenylyltransferase